MPPLQALSVSELLTGCATAMPAEAAFVAGVRLQLLPWGERLKAAHEITCGQLQPIHCAMLLAAVELSAEGGAQPTQPGAAAAAAASRVGTAGACGAEEQARAWALLRHYGIVALDGFETDVLHAAHVPCLQQQLRGPGSSIQSHGECSAGGSGQCLTGGYGQGSAACASIAALTQAFSDTRKRRLQLQWVVEAARGEAALAAALSEVQGKLAALQLDLGAASSSVALAGSCLSVGLPGLERQLAEAAEQLDSLGSSQWLAGVVERFEEVSALAGQLTRLVQVRACAWGAGEGTRLLCCCPAALLPRHTRTTPTSQ